MTNPTHTAHYSIKYLPLALFAAALTLSTPSQADNSTKKVRPSLSQTQTLQNSVQPSQGHSQLAPVFQIPFNASCATGFSKAGDRVSNKDGKSWTDWYVCTTQTITCPKQNQANGETSTVHPTVAIQKTSIDPDGGQVKFRIQYKCDYSYSVIPEG